MLKKEIRVWTERFLLWKKGKGDHPGRHPEENHPFNIDPDNLMFFHDNDVENKNKEGAN